MSNISRPILYFAILATVAVALFWAGFIPTPLSAARRIATDWEERFAARYQLSDDGKVVQLTVGSPDFKAVDCGQMATLIDVKRLDLSGTAIDDEALKFISQMTSLESLRLDGTTVTDAGLANLAGLQTLNELSLSRCEPGRLSEGGIGSLTSLETLTLMGTPLVDSDVTAFRTLSGLKKLHLGNTGLSSACLSELKALGRLQLLNLIGLSNANDEHFVALAGLPNLELLYLDRSEITDAAFAAFVNAAESGCGKLQSVFLEGCSIGDASQDALIKLVLFPNFTKLRLTGTQVSRAVFDEIVKTSPDVSYAHGSASLSED